ncbi:Glutamate--tRNA ligase [Jannaschia seosinensis]|uniref:Glutamate--tRNA ligase n=1 Tax=Jannaschia seosinensis TaxID=313367 RepID=A0A0M7B7X1_9RHOB|nr:glutamate--tRNA ligase [Jannaschia seosinensis]CUH10594.1 Glutamate--tRNA ligase [Jannaschia seosinensis]
MAQEIVTRFAPSPTGYLHIGGARTALFNWLFARGRGGKFLLRIEDTDRARSTDAATQAIFEGLTWLGLDWDGEASSQAANAARHAEVAHQMLERGHAYRCFSTQEEIETFREAARAEGKSTLFHSPWRDVGPADHPDGPSVIRLRAPREGVTIVADAVQGDVTTRNDQLDDMVLLRSDGTPTYMLAVVVDDHDMGVTHVIRGDDHLNNAARQAQIYNAMEWAQPVWAHIPLIHGADGKKLSKRHGATGLEEYAELGFPAPAIRNYLARLGWSHGDDEFFTDAQAREWFDLSGIGKAPARLDLKKLENLSGQHLSVMDDQEIVAAAQDWAVRTGQPPVPAGRLLPAVGIVKDASRTLPQILDRARFALIDRPVTVEDKAANALEGQGGELLAELTPHLHNATWSRDGLERVVGDLAEAKGLGLGKMAAPLRAALAGRTATPSVFDMMLLLGRDESLARILDATSEMQGPST